MDKDIKFQINEYHKLLDELKVEKKKDLLNQFVVGVLIEICMLHGVTTSNT